MNKKNILLKVIIAVFMAVFACSMVACDFGGSSSTKKKDDTTTTTKELKAGDIKTLTDLTDYSSKALKSAVTFNAASKQYAGTDCTEQLNALQDRITQKTEDVQNRESTKSFVKIFVMSTPEGIMQNMADAALTFKEMEAVVAYISGDVEDPDIAKYCAKVDGEWVGEFTGNSIKKWRQSETDTNAKNSDINKGWSLFDDWELYDNLKDYAEDCKNTVSEENKDIADDNASWQYRSILQKVYEDVNLPGDVAARLITHMLEYAIELVQDKTGGSVVNCTENSQYNDFAKYCRKKVTEEDDPMDGLGDYDTLVYLCSFNEFYDAHSEIGMKTSVKLYGYYYDYNATYYKVELKDRAIYAKQLQYEKQDTYTNAEWWDYVMIQRNNYIGSYRYSAKFYRSFYTAHFTFQGLIEDFELEAYPIDSPDTKTTYTKEMQNAIEYTAKGIEGQLAMSDWMWCYGGNEKTMNSYNQASREYNEAKDKTKSGNGTKEQEYEKKFYFELEELKLVAYLLDKMTEIELNGALYYNCYAYSGSMLKTMQTYLKNIRYIQDDMEDGTYYTHIADSVGLQTVEEKDEYAIGKLTVLEKQAYTLWDDTKAGSKATTKQSWKKMLSDIKDAQSYNYEEKVPKSNIKCWETRCEYLEDRVIAKYYSCCKTRISQPEDNKDDCTHGSNGDGTEVTKEYLESCTISMFVSTYEQILFYIAGKANIEFDTLSKGFSVATPTLTTTGDKIIYKAGYLENDIASLTPAGYSEEKTITFGSGKSLNGVINDGDLDTDDENWWNSNDVHNAEGADTAYGPEVKTETVGSKKYNYNYNYTFSYWYLDKECKYEFDADDDIDFDVIVYVGYDIEKVCNGLG